MSEIQAARERAVHLLRMGHTSKEVATEPGYSESWVRKCRRLYQAGGWAGLGEASRAPHQHGTELPTKSRLAIIQARNWTEAVTGLKYVGGRAILKQKAEVAECSQLNGLSERLGTRPKASSSTVTYPRYSRS